MEATTKALATRRFSSDRPPGWPVALLQGDELALPIPVAFELEREKLVTITAIAYPWAAGDVDDLQRTVQKELLAADALATSEKELRAALDRNQERTATLRSATIGDPSKVDELSLELLALEQSFSKLRNAHRAAATKLGAANAKLAGTTALLRTAEIRRLVEDELRPLVRRDIARWPLARLAELHAEALAAAKRSGRSKLATAVEQRTVSAVLIDALLLGLRAAKLE